MKTGRPLPLIPCLLFGLSLPVCGDVWVMDFSGTVQTARGTLGSFAALGSPLSGRIEVDLATLPPNVTLGPVVGVYSYVGRAPGFTFAFTAGDRTVRYDSRNASQEGGLGPAVGMQRGPGLSDSLSFVLREQGDPYTMVLGLHDHTEPMQLLSGVGFPSDIHLSPATLDVVDFSYSTPGGDDLLSAVVSRVSVQIVPEPGAGALVLLGGGVLALLSAGKRPRAERRGPS